MFAFVPWSDYLFNMARDGTYGDEITLQAIADCYSITISVVSTLGPDAAHNIIPNSGHIGVELCLGHFDETNRIHYVLLHSFGKNNKSNESSERYNLFNQKQPEHNKINNNTLKDNFPKNKIPEHIDRPKYELCEFTKNQGKNFSTSENNTGSLHISEDENDIDIITVNDQNIAHIRHSYFDNYFELLPDEILELTSSDFTFPNHV